jgi:hypothetical protein
VCVGFLREGDVAGDLVLLLVELQHHQLITHQTNQAPRKRLDESSGSHTGT